MAVEQDGNALLYASKALQDDTEVVLTAVHSQPDALFYASPDKQAMQRCSAAWHAALDSDSVQNLKSLRLAEAEAEAEREASERARNEDQARREAEKRL